MNVVVTGVTGARNRGVEALLAPLLPALTRGNDGAEVTVLTPSPDYDAWRFRHLPVRFAANGFGGPNGSGRRLRRAGSRVYRPLAAAWRHNVELLEQASVVVATGGDVFSSDYGRLAYHLAPLEVAANASVSIVLLGHSIGPFETAQEADSWLKVARRARLITLRERLSYGYVTQDLGLSTNHVVHTADTAFLLEPVQDSVIHRLERLYALPSDRPVVAACPSGGISHFGGLDYDAHRTAWLSTIRMLVDDVGAHVLLVPHVQETRVDNDDRLLATQLANDAASNEHISLVGGEHSASELKGLISRCALVVSERMHAAIAGLSSGVPTVPIGYSVKARGILTDLLGSESADEVLLPLRNFMDYSTRNTHIADVWSVRHRVASQLREALPEARASAARNLSLLAEVIG